MSRGMLHPHRLVLFELGCVSHPLVRYCPKGGQLGALNARTMTHFLAYIFFPKSLIMKDLQKA